MGKNGVLKYDSYDLQHKLPFKRLSLLFKQIYIPDQPDFTHSELRPTLIEEFVCQLSSLAEQNRSELYYLIDNEIVQRYKPKTVYGETAVERNNLRKFFDEVSPEFKKALESKRLFQTDGEGNEFFDESSDINIRSQAAYLAELHTDDFYPILNTKHSFQQSDKKDKVIQFLLNEIPEPDENTPWETIIDFRNDANTRLKYLALINWINDIAKSNYSIGEIKDKYEYLYHDYMKHFKLYKMKYHNTALEVLVTGCAGILLGLQSGQFITPFSNFLKMKLSYINLLQEEGKLPGKEIAYIYHANGEFTKQ